ncbi:beta-ketoacyl synthase [Talaromyces proteolyticus]|uniref:Beta-ketoacyl synthase n=1 Tax=Talaromyces proteolyticus TaxID=1131652 RepID=A0AAD4L501_9EURO|nr:beta-ketoacyl synthase [Talaromyces proteolyticus]KAH8705998.1 beta-ketoacyl synthase [Talaromyces proteolyticus]
MARKRSLESAMGVPTHRTGTALGDPTEVEALSRVFRKDQRENTTLIGSVKTNLGHGGAAGGLTSIIKATLALEHGQIPATIGLKQLKLKIIAEEWGVQMVTKMTDFTLTACSSFSYLIPFSAKKSPSPPERVEKLSQIDLRDISIEDLSYILGQRRSHLPTRGYIIARQDSLSEDINFENLRTPSTINVADSKPCFVFTGQGA